MKAAAFPQTEAGRTPGVAPQEESEAGEEPEEQIELTPDCPTATNIVLDAQDWHKKFADKFTDTVVVTDTSYTSPDLSVQLSYSYYDTGMLDRSSDGKHLRYGTEVSYVLADIYVGASSVYGFYGTRVACAGCCLCRGDFAGIDEKAAEKGRMTEKKNADGGYEHAGTKQKKWKS